MRTRISNHSRSGLTLLEMMVAVSLLLMIITGLTMMFMQTQRAFKGGIGQVDVFENGRTALELISRDLEQLTPSGDASNLNFHLSMATIANPSRIEKAADTNFIRNFFLLTHGSDWQGISYQVFDTNTVSWSNMVVGTLYRRTTNSARIQGHYLLDGFFNNWPMEQYHRVLDGVVRLQVHVYNADGIEMLSTNGVDSDVHMERAFFNQPWNIWNYDFSYNEVPSYLEIEMGILEPSAVELLRAISGDPQTNPNYYGTQTNFVYKNSGKIHIFRQQIPIRAASR